MLINQSKNFTSSSKIPTPLAITLNDDSNSVFDTLLVLHLPRLLASELCSKWSLSKDSKSTHSKYRALEGSYISSPPDGQLLSRLSRVTKAGMSTPTPCRGDSPTMALGLINAHIPSPSSRVSPCFHVVALELPHFPNNSKAIKGNIV